MLRYLAGSDGLEVRPAVALEEMAETSLMPPSRRSAHLVNVRKARPQERHTGSKRQGGRIRGRSLVVGGSGGEAAREGLVRNRRRDGVQECRMISLARKGGSLYGIRQERPQILSRTGGAHCNLLE